jgi:hypothetical protein
MIIAIRREGERLLATLTVQPEFEIFPESEKKFFWKVVDAHVRFAAKRTTGFELVVEFGLFCAVLSLKVPSAEYEFFAAVFNLLV